MTVAPNDREKSSIASVPDYELDDVRTVTATPELRAMFHSLRGVLLDLTLERAATVRELAAAIGRPPSTVAHHVDVLVRAGLFKVVRTRRVRAVDERFYGRTARIFAVGRIASDDVAAITNSLAEAAAESVPAQREDLLRAVHRRARIPAADADRFWAEVIALVQRFSALPRHGDTTHAFVAGLYPTEFPTLPEPTT
jgi:DNA-binding transcriptional ArsR family regulator